MKEIINLINGIVWSDALVYLCLVTGLYFTCIFGVPQIRYLKQMVKLLFSKESSSSKGISPFQAFSIAISSRVDTALFWMLAIDFLGISSTIIKTTLGQMYKEVKDGLYREGLTFYIQKGLRLKVYACIFAIHMIKK